MSWQCENRGGCPGCSDCRPVEDLEPDSGATFSQCGTWRYCLWNYWDRDLPTLGYCGLNPSTAGKEHGPKWWDLTARKFGGFARRNNYGGWYAANLFGLVSTDPLGLRTFDGDPVGPHNDTWIHLVALYCDAIVPCWGGAGAQFPDRIEHVLGLLADFSLMCFGLTKDGHPKHPSRIPYSTPLVSFKEVHQ